MVMVGTSLPSLASPSSSPLPFNALGSTFQKNDPPSMIPPHNSLVKYDNAILVSTTKADGKQGAKQVRRLF